MGVLDARSHFSTQSSTDYTMDPQAITEQAIDFLFDFGPKILGALIALIIGLWIVGRISQGVRKLMQKRGVEPSLQSFLASMVSVLLKLILFIVVASMIGFETTSLVAVLGAAGLAVGLALQGSLANFAGGVLILLFKPYKVGDLIEAQGEFGQVLEIQIFNTILSNPNNQRVILPNGAVSNGNIKNYTALGKLRIDLAFGIAYDDDIKIARDALMKVMNDHPKVLQDPAPGVHVAELGDSSVNLQVRPWATPTDYWDVYFDVMEQGKVALDQAGITIPFPQRDVHMIPSAS
jgi:small conductance mechanosensitive channel